MPAVTARAAQGKVAYANKQLLLGVSGGIDKGEVKFDAQAASVVSGVQVLPSGRAGGERRGSVERQAGAEGRAGRWGRGREGEREGRGREGGEMAGVRRAEQRGESGRAGRGEEEGAPSRAPATLSFSPVELHGRGGAAGWWRAVLSVSLQLQQRFSIGIAAVSHD